jgi:hypothetical protein
MVCATALVKIVPAIACERGSEKPMKVHLSKDRFADFKFHSGLSIEEPMQKQATLVEKNTILEELHLHLQEAILKEQGRLSLAQDRQQELKPLQLQGTNPIGSNSSTAARRTSISDLSTNASSCSASPDQSDDEGDAMLANIARTTIVMKNLSQSCNREDIVELLDLHGFRGRYDLAYVPVDFASMQSHCYAFVNFTSGEAALEFLTLGASANGFSGSTCVGEGGSKISWAAGMQGLQEAIKKYRDSPVMHALVPDQCKPLLFRNGKIFPFPTPTKKISKPRGLNRKLIGA